jgi:nitrite reductase/ring-hydroxylating ferredoxin subunit
MEPMIPLCNSADLVNGGRAVPFDIVYAGQTCRAFAIRYQRQVHAYLNRCTHGAWRWITSPTVFLTALGSG